MKRIILIFLLFLLVGCLREFSGDFVVLRDKKKEVEHHLYYEGFSLSDANRYAEKIKKMGIFHGKVPLDFKMRKVDAQHWEFQVPLESEDFESVFWQSVLAMVELEFESIVEADVKVFYYDPDLGARDGKAFDVITNERFAWMLPAKAPLDTLQVLQKLKGQVDFFVAVLKEGMERDYSSMSFGQMPRNLYFAINGFGVIPTEELSQKSQELFFDVAGNQLATQLLGAAFYDVSWNDEGGIFRAHYGALSRISQNLAEAIRLQSTAVTTWAKATP